MKERERLAELYEDCDDRFAFIAGYTDAPSLEHTIRYKKNLPINAEVETELKECADSSREWDSKMEHLLHILT